ncbi:MAG: c-type cytochrome domain-containing protein [Pirellulales bacterium]
MLKRIFALSIAVLVLATPTSQAEDKVDFQTQIQPIFAQHCIGCHGEKKASGKMRLHTAAELKKKWDADKELLVAGEPEKSELYQRITLPADDKKRMPQKADPLPKETIELIALWIKQGAVLPEAAAPVTPPAEPEKAEATAPAEKPAEVPLPDVAAAPQEAIDALTAASAQVMPLFADSKLLQVSFAHRSEPAGDAEVALLAGVAEQVYTLNLADAKPSDAGLAPLATLKNLSALHLERAAVTDAGLAHVTGLANLQYLNLYGTNITDAGLMHLAGLKHLQRLYLWQTKVSYDAAMAMEKDIPGLLVNLGYDHPVVVKMRLTKELESVKKQAEEAKAEQAKAEQQLEGAKKNAEAVNARLADVEKQLKELEAPPAEEKKPEAPQAAAEAEKPAEAAEATGEENPQASK